MRKVSRTYRLDPELVLRVEEAADRLGQSLTVFVSRALERALGEGIEPGAAVARLREMDRLRPPPSGPLREQRESEVVELQREIQRASSGCPKCNGTGQLRGVGACPACGGSGKR